MDVLMLRFDAPLMSFGAPVVDEYGKIQPYPALSALAGLLGNALGYDHAEPERLEALQQRLRYAARRDRRGRKIQDYQSVRIRPDGADLRYTDDHMDDRHAWTTWGTVEKRTAGTGTVREIRFRDYWTDAAYTVALTLQSAGEVPTVDDLARAVQHPARPLFIGRKPCLPAEPLFAGRTQSGDGGNGSVAAALLDTLREPPSGETKRDWHHVWWPTGPGDAKPLGDDVLREDMRRPVTDQRDWKNQIHTGERWIAEGNLKIAQTNEINE
jgi:CRISPR system Cascade subunit CasD